MMEKLFSGVFCHQINLDNDSINSGKIAAIPSGTLKYGVVIELIRYATKTRTVASKVEEWVCSLQPVFLELKRSTLKARIKNAFETHKKIERKKKVVSYMSLPEFNNDVFLPSGKKQSVQNNLCEKPTTETESAPISQKETTNKSPCAYETKSDPDSREQKETAKKSPPLFDSETESALIPHVQTVTANKSPSQCDNEIESAPSPIPHVQTVTTMNLHVAPTSTETETLNLPPSPKQTVNEQVFMNQESTVKKTLPVKSPHNAQTHKQNEDKKISNIIQYDILTKQRQLKHLQGLVQIERETVDRLKSTKGHFSVRNVTKRDEVAARNRKNLREMKSHVRQQKQQLETYKLRENENRMCIDDLQRENNILKRENMLLKQEADKIPDLEKVKSNAQKLISYYRRTAQKLREKSDPEQSAKQTEIMERDKYIETLQVENEILSEKVKEINACKSKNSDGTYTNNVRLCVIELFGLEIAVEKISQAIGAVSRTLFDCEFAKGDLPNRTCVQNIVDEGHFIAKKYIAEQIENSESWGLQRDGTTRKKKKILDTAVTLDSGDILSLGFTQVARETAATITDVTKNHLTELAEAHCNAETLKAGPEVTEDYILNSLEKLAFTMSDRASNEKLADKLLTEWRDSVLSVCQNEEEKGKVYHFHCMAHVLLGFHRYLCDDLKKYEKQNNEKVGPVGRDALPVFKYWSKKGTVGERAIRTTSVIFGPVGDHYGLRDRWEAYCSSKGIKSSAITGITGSMDYSKQLQKSVSITVTSLQFCKLCIRQI